MAERTMAEIEAARSRIFDDWPVALHNGGGLPLRVVAPRDGSDAPPDLKRANEALRAWVNFAERLYRDAQTMASEVDRLRRVAVKELSTEFTVFVESDQCDDARRMMVTLAALVGDEHPEVARCKETLDRIDAYNRGR